jgi:hypothetical protein
VWSVFDSWSHWTWVTIAWLQVLLAYAGYLVYLQRRRRRLLEDDRAHRLLAQRPQVSAAPPEARP